MSVAGSNSFKGNFKNNFRRPEGLIDAAVRVLYEDKQGTLWIGTFEGLVSWNGGKLTFYPEIGTTFVTSLLEDREGTVWVGTFSSTVLPAQVCAIRAGSVQCTGNDGAFGSFVWSLGEDGSGTIWAAADSGVWRWNPGPAQRYAMPGMRVGDLLKSDDGRLLIGATVEEAGYDKRTIPDTIQRMHRAAIQMIPALADARFLEAWAGLRPGTPDDLPILGATGTPGYFAATGHFRDGILLAPITAHVMAQVVTGVAPEYDLSAFSPARFAKDAKS